MTVNPIASTLFLLSFLPSSKSKNRGREHLDQTDLSLACT